jgi:tRNA threonylcarbamoyladenosine biosynthesis protein TsaB
MIKILCIETSEKKCSVALSIDGKCAYYAEENEDQSHARLLTTMIAQLLDNQSVVFGDLSGVCVTSGPGSYTGLRIGVSTAKGICWASDLKLLSLRSTEVIAFAAKEKNKQFDWYFATLDARRNEVFIEIYDQNSLLEEVKALILDDYSLDKYADNSLYITGSGANKFAHLIKPTDAIDDSILPNAKDMCQLAFEKYTKQAFEDLAYFEPKYVKSVYTTSSTKKIFG